MTPSTMGEPDNEQKIDDDIVLSRIESFIFDILNNFKFYNRLIKIFLAY